MTTLLRKLTRQLYRYRGFATIAHLIRRFMLSAREVLVDDFDGDLMFYCKLDEHMGSQIYWRGFYSGPLLAVLEPLLNSDSVFVDVGANHGEFTVFAAKRLSRGRVIAFEPDSILHERLLRNIDVNSFTNVQPIKKGLWRENASMDLYTSEKVWEDGSMNDGLGTLFKTDTRNEIRESVELVRLDDILPELNIHRLDVMKIDVEGAELGVIEGAQNTINKFRPFIIMEVTEGQSSAAGYQAQDLINFVRDMSYEIHTIGRNGTMKPVPDSIDYQNVLCSPIDLHGS